MIKDEDKTKDELLLELKELRERLSKYEESTVDELTSLHNIRYFLVLAEHEFTRAVRYGRPLSFIILSLDNSEEINDTYGHAIVDKALDTVAVYCRKNVRYVDIFGRYGDEEFVLLLPEADLEATRLMADRIREYVSQTPVPTKKGPVKITISLGVDTITKDTPNLISLLELADRAMNFARKSGGNRVEVV